VTVRPSPTARRPTATLRDALRALADPRARPSVPWLMHLTGASRPAVEEVLAELGAVVRIEEQIRASHLAAGRPSYAQIGAPFDLYALTRLLRPDHIVEAGVSSGVSSAHFLLGLKKNRHGRLHSIDRPTFQQGATLGENESPVSIPPGRSSGWAVPDELRSGWDLYIGRSQDLLPEVVGRLPSVGIFLHDDLHTPKHLAFELRTVRPKLFPGAVVLADNTNWTGNSFPAFAADLGVRSFRRRPIYLLGLRYPGKSAKGRGARPRPRK
jgi:Methyltransferase domain